MVRKIEKNNHITNTSYFQKFIKGQIISVQFSRSKKNLNLLSFCKQWNYKTESNPFLLGGIMTFKISTRLKKKIQLISEKVSSVFNLNGLNSIDFILKDEKLFLVDINARIGLSFNLLTKIYKKRLFDKKIKYLSPKIICASSIFYSKKKIQINKKIVLKLKALSESNNFSELPMFKDVILKDEPICLIHTNSNSEKRIMLNIKNISKKINNIIES